MAKKISKIRISIILLVDVMLVAAAVLLFQVDRMVNGTFYQYGLTFSLEWAEPYWIMFRISLVLIFVAVLIISVLELPYPSFEAKQD